ncbi:hypothetical protein [Pseudanabaena sp. Chao 1811]|nr:hypothetical protein [Pseudanabaena sp. Chao 1811]
MRYSHAQSGKHHFAILTTLGKLTLIRNFYLLRYVWMVFGIIHTQPVDA